MPETSNQSAEKKIRRQATLIINQGAGNIALKNSIGTIQKQIPMLYSCPMVKSLKIKTKEETRRTRNLDEINKTPNAYKFLNFGDVRGDVPVAMFEKVNKKGAHLHGTMIKFPYGHIGDKIWVRETFTYVANGENFLYRADFLGDNGKIVSEQGLEGVKWTPNIHMPKLAARIWLEITDITCERLQDITTEGALSEGIEIRDLEGTTTYRDYSSKRDRFAYGTHFKPRDSYKTLWESINGRGSWKKNPWVWVVKFKTLSIKK